MACSGLIGMREGWGLEERVWEVCVYDIYIYDTYIYIYYIYVSMLRRYMIYIYVYTLEPLEVQRLFFEPPK